MVNTKSRRTVCCILIGLLLVFIWGNSLLPADISSKISTAVRDLLSKWFPHAPSDSPAQNEGVLRKLAHFTEYCGLGIYMAWLTGMIGLHPLLPLCGGIFISGVDETIQFFVPGRSSELRDVCIDCMGVLLGTVLTYAVHILYGKIRRKTDGDR